MNLSHPSQTFKFHIDINFFTIKIAFELTQKQNSKDLENKKDSVRFCKVFKNDFPSLGRCLNNIIFSVSQKRVPYDLFTIFPRSAHRSLNFLLSTLKHVCKGEQGRKWILHEHLKAWKLRARAWAMQRKKLWI